MAIIIKEFCPLIIYTTLFAGKEFCPLIIYTTGKRFFLWILYTLSLVYARILHAEYNLSYRQGICLPKDVQLTAFEVAVTKNTTCN